MQPLQGVLQHHVHIHAATTIRFATARCRTPWRNQSHVNTKGPYPPPTQAALHRRSHFTRKKMRCFVLRLPPQHQSHATFMQPLQCILQHHVHIHAAITMRFATVHNWLYPLYKEKRNVSRSAFPSVTTTPQSPLLSATTCLSHHFPPLVTTSLSYHFPLSPLPLVTISLSHHFSMSPRPSVTTSLSHP